jgi:hypothetical protein
MRRERLEMRVKCKSIWRGLASVGEHIIEEAKFKSEDLIIESGKEEMTIPFFKLGKFFSYGKGKEYPHKDGRPGTYKLKYIKWEPDSEQT